MSGWRSGRVVRRGRPDGETRPVFEAGGNRMRGRFRGVRCARPQRERWGMRVEGGERGLFSSGAGAGGVGEGCCVR